MILDCTPQFALDVLSGQWRLLEPLLELLLLPLAFHVLLLLPLLFAPDIWIVAYAAVALAIVGVHVFAGIYIGGGSWLDVLALGAAPFYVIWKLTLVRALRRNAAKDAAWVRTERESSSGAKK